MGDTATKEAGLELRREGATLELLFSGKWGIGVVRPAIARVMEALDEGGGVDSVRFDSTDLVSWDTTLLTFVQRCCQEAERRALNIEVEGLPDGVRNMIQLSRRAGEVENVPEEEGPDLLTVLGIWGRGVYHALENWFEFFGLVVLEGAKLLRGRVQMRSKDFLFLLQGTSVAALPIICLLSLLTGLILGFIGVIQLQKLAADIYVADLVGLAMARELGPVMVGVIMAGRTGAAFAAQIGSMRVNEEIDALTSFGISPVQFLVLPRVLALVLMMPLLCGFADVMGMLGGMAVSVWITDTSVLQYCLQLEQAVLLRDLLVGLFKSGVFGMIIALTGCYRGLRCGKDASSVGLAATSAVVTSITWIVFVDALFAVIFHILGI
ncbi:MAG: MlaE family ABC transporter permease [Opitutales bacterium]